MNNIPSYIYQNRRGRDQILPISLLAGLLGLVGGIAVWQGAIGAGYEFFPVASGLSAFVTTAFFWWLLVARPDRFKIWAGALAGGLSGAVSHYVCWYFSLGGFYLCYVFTGGCVSSLGDPPLDPLYGVLGAAVFSVFSLLLIGWITVPLGAVAGALWVWQQERRKDA